MGYHPTGGLRQTKDFTEKRGVTRRASYLEERAVHRDRRRLPSRQGLRIEAAPRGQEADAGRCGHQTRPRRPTLGQRDPGRSALRMNRTCRSERPRSPGSLLPRLPGTRLRQVIAGMPPSFPDGRGAPGARGRGFPKACSGFPTHRPSREARLAASRRRRDEARPMPHLPTASLPSGRSQPRGRRLEECPFPPKPKRVPGDASRFPRIRLETGGLRGAWPPRAPRHTGPELRLSPVIRRCPWVRHLFGAGCDSGDRRDSCRSKLHQPKNESDGPLGQGSEMIR